MARELNFKLRLDEEDRARLDALAEHYAAPRSTAVRMMIKHLFDQLGLSSKIHGKKRSKS